MSKTKILLVDDRRENLVALEHIIAQPDVQVLTAASADDALALLLEYEFALALLDVQMPRINGFELARLMRTAERSRSIPIIFVTASEREQGHVFEGYEKGAVDYLLKPLDAHIVRSKVRVFVELDQKTQTLRQKLREVDALRAAAESASQAKSRFLANMSHEIRTPLGAVLGYADLLSHPNQSLEDKAVCAEAIKRNSQLLLHLVNDILDLAKIEAEHAGVELAPTSLAELAFDIKTVHAHKAMEKGLALEIIADGMLPHTVVTDALRLRQILNNIVGNAVKFTDHGKVTVKLSFDQRRLGGTLVFRVADTGCGLSEAEASRIFYPFVQADDSTTRRFGGTGLGLVIAKQLAILLGGDVVLESSDPTQGSTFAVAVAAGDFAEADLTDGSALLRGRVLGSAATSDPLVRLDGLYLLVADDALDNRHLLSRVLVRAGARVDTAADGAEAVEKALREDYDVILMDMQMPGTDGYEATGRLRRQGYTKPIIALTAHAMKEELARCIEAGCDFSLGKPVANLVLTTAIAGYAPKGKTAAADLPTVSPEAYPGQTSKAPTQR